jgi:malto-oligosyltrehalose trehalohydrolase
MSRPARFGPELHRDGATFRIWAPAAKQVELLLDRPYRMQSHGDGWHDLTLNGAGPGTRYRFRIDGELDVPDPASHFQPEDIAGPSEIVDHNAFQWRANDWRGRPWQEAVTLECHVGTFAPGGDFRAMRERLDDVAATGITAIELMPIADFPGRWNWGYDGVLLYAPDSNYGTPDDLKALVDAAHLRGLMVFLDVVYNHFGPEGNFLGRYAPAFFTQAHTPWGASIDYRVPEVREFAIGNALHWLSHYRFDGLRLDAVHAIAEPGARLLLTELSRAVGELAAASGRHIHLVLENDDNRAALLDPMADPPRGAYRAQWNDDYHHAWHVLLTGENTGYYRDYHADPRRHIARALASGFAYQGEKSVHRGGKPRGESSGALSPLAFVNFLQNHDQIGNRPLGERLVTQAGARAIDAALAITLLAPMPPLLFMGEEWGSTKPFPFFCDFHGELADAVRKGRRAEFKHAYDEYGDAIPDPLAETTFRAAKLDWDARATPAGRTRLALVQNLLRARREHVTPHLAGVKFGRAHFDADVLIADWPLNGGRTLMLLANLSENSAARPSAWMPARVIWGGAPPDTLPPWSVYWAMGT